MLLSNLLKNTNSTRHFNNKIVNIENIKKILENARYTSSGGNIQPWKVTCVTNIDKLNEISKVVEKKILNEEPLEIDIQYYPTIWKKEYQLRRAITGKEFYEISNVNRRNIEERKKAWIDNFKWFGGSTVLFIHVDKIFTNSSIGMLMDVGSFIQSIVLSAEELGISHCVQGSVGEYAISIKDILDIPEDHSLLVSIVLGYKQEDIKNTYKPKRLNIDEFTRFI